MVTCLVLGATYGFAAGAQPGQLQAYLISRAVAHGWRRTLPAACAPVLSDAPIIALVLFVLTRVPPLLVHVLQTVGGLFLIYLASGALAAYRNAQGTPAASPRQTLLSGHGHNYGSIRPAMHPVSRRCSSVEYAGFLSPRALRDGRLAGLGALP